VAPDLASTGTEARFVLADLDAAEVRAALPLSDGSQDAVLASLLLSYVKDPAFILREIRRVSKRGARIVVSTMKPDADTSALFVQGSKELHDGIAGRLQREIQTLDLDHALRSFLNDAARLLDFEERGVFRFWNDSDLIELLRSEGFREVRVYHALGSPGQALIAVARRP
jgi:ubiquinone/menaquinone biosynthesis C-methylase UbiE